MSPPLTPTFVPHPHSPVPTPTLALAHETNLHMAQGLVLTPVHPDPTPSVNTPTRTSQLNKV